MRLRDQVERVQRGWLLGQADHGKGAVLLQEGEVWLEGVRGRSRVEDEVEGAGVSLHRVFVRGEDDLIGAEFESVILLLERGGELDGWAPKECANLSAHVAESAEADDADLLAGAGIPMAQRRIGGDAGAEQGRDGGEIEILRDGVSEALVDNIIVGIAAHGDGSVDAVFDGVGERELLQRRNALLRGRRERSGGRSR